MYPVWCHFCFKKYMIFSTIFYFAKPISATWVPNPRFSFAKTVFVGFARLRLT